MRDLFKKIYENIIYYEKDTISMNKDLNKKIENYIQPYTNKLTKSELEDLKSILYKTSLDSQEDGFYLGVKYSIKIFTNTLLK